MSDYVLVHGTTQCAAGWRLLERALRKREHQVLSVELARYQQPYYFAADYALTVAGEVEERVRDPIVVAHSASGLLLPSITRALGGRHQVWLAAYVPDVAGGRSLIEEIQEHSPTIFNNEWIGADPVGDPVAGSYFLFHDCDLPTLRWALGTLQRFDLERVYTEAPADSVDLVASTYLLPALDRTLRPSWMDKVARARLGVEPVTFTAAGHCPHVSHPESVADLLHELG